MAAKLVILIFEILLSQKIQSAIFVWIMILDIQLKLNFLVLVSFSQTVYELVIKILKMHFALDKK